MKRIIFIALCVILISGCASVTNLPNDSFSPAQVKLDKNNFRMIKANAEGVSSGFSFLGIVPITVPSRTTAMSRLYRRAGIRDTKAYALINVANEQTSTYLLVFSIPTYRIRADVIEFIDADEKGNAPEDN